MESDPVQMYQISQLQEPNNKENVVLRALVCDPNRHKPLAQHPMPATTTNEEQIPASMYTLETRYRPIPPKVLPKQTESRLYYIDSQKAGQTSRPSSPMVQENKPLPAESEAIEHEEPVPTVFLEPKIVQQPVLYSIVGAKTIPVPNIQPVSVDQDEPLPLLYSIIGEPHRPARDMNATTSNIATAVINKSPILYTLIGYPRLQVRFQEPIEQVAKVSQVPQAAPPNLYTVVGGPRIQPKTEEPVKQILKVSTQPSPTLFSIIGNPTIVPNITQTNIIYSQPTKTSSIQPAPILYTVVGETQVPNNIPKENRQPLATIKRQTNDVTMYAVVGDHNIPKSMPPPHKAQPLQPLKQPLPVPQQQQQQQQQQPQIPSLYPLVGKPSSLPDEKTEAPLKPLVRTRSPQRAIVPTRRISRSLDRQTAPEPRSEPMTSMPPIKNKRQRPLKDPTIPKSETIFYPLPENQRPPRSKQPRTTPWYTSPERGEINHRNFQIPRYGQLQLGDYISPYAYHPTRPYREQTIHPSSLPIVSNNRSERKARSRFHETPYRGERKHPYDPWTPHSLERYPVKNGSRSRLWDFEDPAQSDNDGDDTNGLDSYRSRGKYRRYRPRTPWIPVW